MKLIHRPDETGPTRFTVEPFSDAGQAAADAMRSWHPPADLFKFALGRHGYGNTDIYSGVTYPDDVDEGAEDESIPEGWVEVYAGDFNGEGDNTYTIPETDYLLLLRQYLEATGHGDLAQQIDGNTGQISSPNTADES